MRFSPGATCSPAIPFVFFENPTRRVIPRFQRHCERSEAIHPSACGAMDCFAPLAMTARGLCLTCRDKSLILAGARRGNRDAAVGIFVQLVAQRADRDAENVGGMGAVAQAVF